MEQKALRIVANGLVPIYENEEARRVVNARELHGALKVGRDFSNWMKDRFEKYGFVEGEDYVVFANFGENPQGGRPSIDYLLTIDVAKEIAMVENNEIGHKVRRYFIECEKRALDASNPVRWYDGILNDPVKANDFIMKINQSWKKDRDNMLALEAKIESDSGKVAFADSVAASDDSILIRQFAKQLEQNGFITGEKRLYETFRQDGYLIKKPGGDRNTPTQKAMEMGLFTLKETAITHSDGRVTLKTTPRITGKGQLYFTEKYLGRAIQA